MTAPASVRITEPAARWQLEFDRSALEQASAGWESLYTGATQRADTITQAANRVYGPQWEGPTATAYHTHRKKVTKKLDDLGQRAARAAGIVAHASGSLDAAQTQLVDSLRRAAAVCTGPVGVDGSSLVFEVADQTAAAVVAREVAQAIDIRNTLTSRLQADTAELRRLTLAVNADAVTTREMDFGGSYWATVAEARAASVLTVGNQVIFNTGTGDDRVEVRPDPATGGVMVDVNGTTHPVAAGMEPVIRTGAGNDVVRVARGTAVRLTVLGGEGDDDLGSVPYDPANFNPIAEHDVVDPTTGATVKTYTTTYTDTHAGGGEGDDSYFGGRGNDKIHTGAGANYADGGPGRDYVEGGAGNDILRGGRGNDTIYGLDGQDRLSGGADRDFLDGGRNDDIASGGTGNDAVFGGMGADRLLGGAGTDRGFGGEGVDRADLGSGSDRAYLQRDDISTEGGAHRVEVQYVAGLGGGFISIQGSPEFQALMESNLESFRSLPDQTMMQTFENLHRATPTGSGSTLIIQEVQEDDDSEYDPTTPGNPTVQYFVRLDPTSTMIPGRVETNVFVDSQHEFGHVVQGSRNAFDEDTMRQKEADGSYTYPRVGERDNVGLSTTHTHTPGQPTPSQPQAATENWLRSLLGMPARTRY